MSDVPFDEIRKVAAALDKNRINKPELDAAWWAETLEQYLPEDLKKDLLNLPPSGDDR